MGTDLTNLPSMDIPTKKHSKEAQIDLKVEVYSVLYDWGVASLGSPNFQEYSEPYFQGTLDGQFTSANFSIDGTSDIRYTCSLSIILDYSSPFIVHANDNIFWQQHWLKITKIYEYPNGNLETGNNIDEHVIGWFAPNSCSCDYNAETREFSLSCTDIISFLTESRGGHLTHWEESISGYVETLRPYSFLQFAKGDNVPPWLSAIPEGLKEDMDKVSRCASGLVLEGEKTISLESQQHDNFLSSKNDDNNQTPIEETNMTWKDKYDKYKEEHKKEKEKEPWRENFDEITKETRSIRFSYLDKNGEWQDVFYENTNNMVTCLVSAYAHIIPIQSVLVDLQDGYRLPPYDLEFNGDVTLYDVIKKITDLYPDQTIYLDADRRLNIKQNPQPWRGVSKGSDIAVDRHDLLGLTLEEHWNVSLENIKNYTVVWGRDQSCVGYYWVSSCRGLCPKCGTYHESANWAGLNGDRFTCKKCGTPLRRLGMMEDTFSIARIGTHKQVVYNDNLLTDEECYNTAKALTWQNCRAKRTLSVTIMDRYLPMYNLSNGGYWGSDTGVGRLFEYTSETTGETELYTILKWSNDFNSGTVTLELEPCQAKQTPFGILSVPNFSCGVDSKGLLTIKISQVGEAEIYKVYYRKGDVLDEGSNWNWATLTMNFLGETENSEFQYQFTESGRFAIAVEAWSPVRYRSGVDNIQIINVTISEDTRIDINTSGTTTEINGSSVGIGVKHLITKDGEYITDNEGNRFIY